MTSSPQRARPPRATLLASLLFTLVLTACGGDDNETTRTGGAPTGTAPGPAPIPSPDPGAPPPAGAPAPPAATPAPPAATPAPPAGSPPSATPAPPAGSPPAATPAPPAGTPPASSPPSATPAPPANPPATGTPPAPTPPALPPAPPPASPVATTGNPYANAAMYLDPDYGKKVRQSLSRVPAASTDGGLIQFAASFPTAVWLDRIAAIDGAKATGGALGLAEHLDAAVAQQKALSGTGALKPLAITLVVYDLPDRDCAAFASNGELQSANGGMARYKTEYIDRIAEIVARPAYANLRIVTVIEPDSFPNMITNTQKFEACAKVAAGKVYEQGIQYAIGKLATVKNVHMYLDIAHSGWLGWPDNRSKAIQQFTALIKGATPEGRLDVIRGFASNTANYTPLDEPFFDGTADVIDKGKTTEFYEFNPAVDEMTYVDMLRKEFVAAGFPTTLSFIVDTSRNGWGGALRPTKAAPDVDDMRIDRRGHRGNWCNVKNTGIGERPRANPDPSRPHVDAFVFIKPPGDSDGTSDASANMPNEEGKRYDEMCGPKTKDSLVDAPHAGQWFHDQFLMLLRNAHPTLK